MLKSGYRTNGIEQDKNIIVETDGNKSTKNRRNNNNSNRACVRVFVRACVRVCLSPFLSPIFFQI